MVEEPERELVEAVVALAAFQQVAEDHGVGDRPLDRDPRAAEGQHVVLEVLADLLDLGVGEDRSECFEHELRIEQAIADRPP